MLGSTTANVAATANDSQVVSISETGTSAVKTTPSTADSKFSILFVCIAYYVLPLYCIQCIMTENHENFSGVRKIGIVLAAPTQ